MDQHLKGEAEKAAYFDLVENAEDGVWSVDESGQPKEDNTYWKGFGDRTAKALRLEKRSAE